MGRLLTELITQKNEDISLQLSYPVTVWYIYFYVGSRRVYNLKEVAFGGITLFSTSIITNSFLKKISNLGQNSTLCTNFEFWTEV